MIIGLGYKARVGKDTVGTYLKERHGYDITSFAYSLKEAVKTIYGWTDNHVYGSLKEVIDPYWEVTPREVMQKFGTDACRNNLDQQIWVKSVQRRITSNARKNWVITDVRFPNEARFVSNLGGLVIRLDRDDPDAIAEGTATHSSETAMDNYGGWNNIIKNNGTLDELFTRVEEVLKEREL